MASVGNGVRPSAAPLHHKPASVLEPSHQFFGSSVNRFRSFPAPGRAHPFRPLSHLPEIFQSLSPVPDSRKDGDRLLPSDAGAVLTTIKHDVQSDAAAVGTMDMGIPSGTPTTRLEFKGGDRCQGAERHRERFVRGHISSFQREVFPRRSLSLGLR